MIVENILRSLRRVAEDETFFVIVPSGCGLESLNLPAGSELFLYRGNPLSQVWFEHRGFSRMVRQWKPDLVFGAGNVGLMKREVTQALLIHTAYPLYERKYFGDMSRIGLLRKHHLKVQIGKSLSASDLAFVQTPIIQERVKRLFGFPEEQIRVLRFPVPEDVLEGAAEGEGAIAGQRSHPFFVLVLTRYLSHRNPSCLIPLCRRYRRELEENHIQFLTTVTAGEHPHSGRFLKAIEKHGLGHLIVNRGMLNRTEVARSLRESQVLWLPTTLETLCLPYLEGMALGIPILAPDLDFARHVCGSAAEYYTPWDIDSVFQALMKMRHDETLRRRLVERGRQELRDAGRFSRDWEETTRDLMSGLRSLAGTGSVK